MSLTRLKSSMSSITRPSGWSKRRAAAASAAITCWKRPWLERPVSSSVTAWRWTCSCRSTFSSERPVWRASEATSSRSAAVNGLPWRATETIPRGACSASPSCWAIGAASARRRRRRWRWRRASPSSCACASAAAIACSAPASSPTRAASSSGPSAVGADRGAAALPLDARRRSSACRSPAAPTRSRLAAKVAPMRWIESRSRARSSASSSTRCSSSLDILLNSRPSWANSSLPSTGTVVVKSPPPIRLAAARKRSSWPCSWREISSAPTNASSRKQQRAARARSTGRAWRRRRRRSCR